MIAALIEALGNIFVIIGIVGISLVVGHCLSKTKAGRAFLALFGYVEDEER